MVVRYFSCNLCKVYHTHKRAPFLLYNTSPSRITPLRAPPTYYTTAPPLFYLRHRPVFGVYLVAFK